MAIQLGGPSLLEQAAIKAGYIRPSRYSIGGVAMGQPQADIEAYQRAQIASQRQADLNKAQQVADNNIAISRELERRGIKDVGLLARANEVAYRIQNANQGSPMMQMATRDRKRLLQDAGYNITMIGQKPAFSQEEKPQRAQLRKRRGQY